MYLKIEDINDISENDGVEVGVNEGRKLVVIEAYGSLQGEVVTAFRVEDARLIIKYLQDAIEYIEEEL
jgi:hypothetical protein